MESTVVESQAPRLSHDPTETSSTTSHHQEATSHSPFILIPSRRDDSPFTFLFLTAILTTFTFGIAILASTRTEGLLHMGHAKLRLSLYNPTTNTCELQLSPQQKTTPPAASGCDSDQADGDYSDSTTFVARLALDFLFALTLAVPVTLLLVSLLHRYARPLLVLTAPVLSVLLLALGLSGGFFSGLLWFSWSLGATSEVWGSGAVGMLMARRQYYFVAVYCWYYRAVFGYGIYLFLRVERPVEKGLEILTMAMRFWKEHFLLLLVNPALFMVAMGVVNGPILAMVWHAFNVGEVVPDFDVVEADRRRGGESCALATGSPCCREERPGWVFAYITVASITTFWVFMVLMVLQHAVVSGTVSLWFFTRTRTNSSAKSNIKRSLRNAYGPSFGIACNLGTIFTTFEVALVRTWKKKILSYIISRSNGKAGIVWSTFLRCFLWIFQLPNYYSQMPSIFLGLIPESSETSQIIVKPTSSFFGNNSQDLANVAYLEMICIFTLLQTIVVHKVLEHFMTDVFWLAKFMVEKTFGHCPVVVIITVVVGMVSGVFVVVTSVLDSVSVCYALRRDNREILKPEACRTFLITTSFIT